MRKGYVSLERARTDYAVAIDRERLAIVEDETEALRAEMRSSADDSEQSQRDRAPS